MKRNKPLELLLKKIAKEFQYVDLKKTKPFDGVLEVTDENGHVRAISIPTKGTIEEIEKIVDEVQNGDDPRVVNDRAHDLLELILKKYPYNDAIKLIKRMETLSDNDGKISQLCKLSVDVKGWISFISPDGKKIRCDFERGRLGRALYVLYLRQIERSANDSNTPPFICRNRLVKYKDELLAIYSKMCDNRNMEEMRASIEKLWRNPTNEISQINVFFDRTFDNEALNGKYYSIEQIDETDDEKPEAIGLTIDDFDLGCYSIRNLIV